MSGFSRDSWRENFEISPIWLTSPSGSTTSNIAGSVTSLMSMIGDLYGSDFDQSFAHFIPLPGATVIDNQIATYPFANQAVAANALITQPLQISLKMVCPVTDRIGYWAKLNVMQAIRGVLYKHCVSAGTFTVQTPSWFYTNCILTRMHDISAGSSTQPQHTWQLDFVRPLLATDEADNIANSMISRVNNGGQVTSSSWSGTSTNVGAQSVNLTTSDTGGGLAVGGAGP